MAVELASIGQLHRPVHGCRLGGGTSGGRQGDHRVAVAAARIGDGDAGDHIVDHGGGGGGPAAGAAVAVDDSDGGRGGVTRAAGGDGEARNCAVHGGGGGGGVACGGCSNHQHRGGVAAKATGEGDGCHYARAVDGGGSGHACACATIAVQNLHGRGCGVARSAIGDGDRVAGGGTEGQPGGR